MNDLGQLNVAKLSPAGYKEISRVHLIGPMLKVLERPLVRSFPALYSRRVHLRSHG